MDKDVLKLKVVMDYINGGIHLKTFNDRLILQKSIYLMQRLGIDLGYRFSWYIHGPYSSELTEVAYTYNENLDYYKSSTKMPQLTDYGDKKLKQTKALIELFTKYKPLLKKEQWLELIASIDYLCNIAKGIKVNETNIYEELAKYKKDRFTRQDVINAMDALKNNDLFI